MEPVSWKYSSCPKSAARIVERLIASSVIRRRPAGWGTQEDLCGKRRVGRHMHQHARSTSTLQLGTLGCTDWLLCDLLAWLIDTTALCCVFRSLCGSSSTCVLVKVGAKTISTLGQVTMYRSCRSSRSYCRYEVSCRICVVQIHPTQESCRRSCGWYGSGARQ